MGKERIPHVLESVARVVRRARYVTIDEQAVRRWAGAVAHCPCAGGADDEALLFTGSRADCANYVLLADALNFCFWSDEPWEVEYRGRNWTRTFAMMAGLLRAIDRERAWLSAERWAEATDADVEVLFGGTGRIPLPELRRDILRQTGSILHQRFGGQFDAMIEAEGGDARRVAYRLAECFPSFCDVSHYDTEPVAFLKRAQICAADLHRAWLANGFAGLTNMEALTVFADYRLPQLFRHEGMLRLVDELAGRIDRTEIIEAGSPEEIEIRAATVWIGKLLCEALSACGRTVAPWQLDFELWTRAKAPQVTVPHHRTITHFY